MSPERFTVKVVEHRGFLFLLFFLALSAIALSTWQGVSYFVGKREQAVLMQNAINNGLNRLQDRAVGELSGTATALHIASNSPALRRYLASGMDNNADLEQVFHSFIEASPDVYQIAFIDREGLEHLRIDKRGDAVVRIAGEQLRNRSNQAYFREASQLPEGEIYVSDLNLNLEQDAVETPWQPTIRLATPLYATDERFAGVLKINVDVSDIIAAYRAVDLEARVDLMLVNDQGYWLYGRPDEYLWGFMFDKGGTLKEESPAAWQNIATSESRVFEIGADSWTYQAARVMDLFPAALDYSAPDKVLWYAVVKNPPQPLASGPLGYIAPLAIVIALIAFSWAWSRSVIERRRAQRELIKAEKLSSLGGLVAGVAHELNTPIGSAVTTTSTLQERANELEQMIRTGSIKKSEIVMFVDDAKHATTIMLRGLNRAIELISHFKQIAVDQSGEQRRRFDVDEYIKEMCATINHLFKHRRVRLELELHSGATLDSYPGPLSQVVINLVQNALLHGFDPDETGIIRITTRRLEQDRVELTVTDSGRGIAPDLLERVFDPFFTTKLGQGGSGLGLHIVYNIVNDVLGGHISLVSDPERRFTQFTVVIPCTSVQLQSSSAEKSGYVERPAA